MRAIAVACVVVSVGCASSSMVMTTPAVARRAAPGPVARPEGAQPPRLDVHCEDPETCPEAVGMLVAPGAHHPERCTAALVAPNRVVTAAHCVTPVLGEPATCDDTWVAFPAAGETGAVWARCVSVLDASTLPDDGVLRSDVAHLELESPVARRHLDVAPAPPVEGRIVSVVAVTPHRIYATQHELAVRLCRAGFASDAADVIGPDATRVGWLRDCPIYPGNSGAPVLDPEGRIAALVHGGSHPFFGIGVTTPLW